MYSNTNSSVSRRTRNHHDRNVYGNNARFIRDSINETKNTNNNINDFKLLFNNYRQFVLPKTITNTSFSLYYSKIYNIIEWIDDESSIFDRKKFDCNEFDFIKNTFNDNFNLIENGIQNLDKLLKNDQKISNNYSIYNQKKEKLKLINNEYNLIKKKLNKNIFYFDRKYQIQKSKEKLLKGANINNNNNNNSLADEHSHLSSSKNLVNDALNMVNDITNNLKNQGNMLKNIQTKIFSFMNKVGFSNTIMKTIQKRTQMDFILCIIGSIFILIFVFVLWYFFG